MTFQKTITYLMMNGIKVAFVVKQPTMSLELIIITNLMMAK